DPAPASAARRQAGRARVSAAGGTILAWSRQREMCRVKKTSLTVNRAGALAPGAATNSRIVRVKVSVVIPTYASPPDRLESLVSSLDAQTMPTDDFEVIFVDDGSPDDTWDRLETIKRQRSNVRTERIENSGWPSRPRNVG